MPKTCRQCGKRPPSERFKRCDICREKNRLGAERYRRKSGIPPRPAPYFPGFSKAEKGRLLRQEQKAKGLCQAECCQNRPEPGRTLCRRHLEMIRKVTARWRQQCKAAGICVDCRKRPAIEGQVRCEACRRKHVRTDRPPRPVLRAEREARQAEIERRRNAELQAEFADIQRYILAVTSKRARKIVLRRCGPHRETLQKLATRMRITRERVRQLEAKAIDEINAAKRRGGQLTDATRIADAPITVRLENILRRIRIQNIGELRGIPMTTLLTQRGFGVVCLDEVNALLQQEEYGDES